MRYAPEDEPELPHLRRLRLMVMALMGVLMLGILAIAATIVIRLGFGSDSGAVVGVSAASIALPADAEVIATGQGPGTVHVTLRASDGTESLWILDAETGDKLSATPITRN